MSRSHAVVELGKDVSCSTAFVFANVFGWKTMTKGLSIASQILLVCWSAGEGLGGESGKQAVENVGENTSLF